MKLVLWLAIAGLIVAWWVRNQKKKSASDSAASPVSEQGSSHGEKMLQCARCRVHFPASEAVRDASGAVFCCEEHGRRRS